MSKKTALFIPIVFVIGIFFVDKFNSKTQLEVSGAPPYGEPQTEAPDSLDPYNYLRNWVRPEGPPKVALQVGHWKSSEFPDELERLRNNTGSSGGGKWEWEVNYKIAEKMKPILEQEGIIVEILPATVPSGYFADVFLAIHADGSTDKTASGYKFASPWRDFSKKADTLVTYLEKSYDEATTLEKDPNISRNMRGYYAFSWWRYTHAIHPMTTAAIAETGFLTSANDRKLIVDNPEISAKAMADAVIKFLREEKKLWED